MKKIYTVLLSLMLTFSFLGISVFTSLVSLASEDNTKENNGTKTEVSFNRPNETRSVHIKSGIDFLTYENMTQDAVKKEIDNVISYIKDIGFNTIVIDTLYKDQVIYSSEFFKTVTFADNYFDILSYIIQKSRENSIYVYIEYDLNLVTLEDKAAFKSPFIDSKIINKTFNLLDEIILKYNIDAIVLNDYYTSLSPEMYLEYRKENSGLDFSTWSRQWIEGAFQTIAFYIKDKKPNIQFGAYFDEVWLQAAIVEGGTPSNKPFSAFLNGLADTKDIIEKTNIDFAIVKTSSTTVDNESNFSNVLNWWASFISKKGIPMYIEHNNSLIGSNQNGWNKHDQIIRQAIAARSIPGFSGSSFESLKTLKANPYNSTTSLLKYYKNEVDVNLLLTDFSISNMPKNEFTTYETEQSFIGAADPQYDLTLNGEKINVEKNGAFSVSRPLNIGWNSFSFEHKGETYNYKINRTVNIFSSISPTGTLRTEGSTVLELKVVAYKGSTITAKINGSSIKLVEADVQDDEKSGNSYTAFIGSYKIPSATAQDRSIGSIVYTGSFQGITQSKTGANIIINKMFIPPVVVGPPTTGGTNGNTGIVKPDIPGTPSPYDNFQMVIVKSGGAEGYDPGHNTKYPAINSHSLPGGTVDYIASNRIVFNGEGYYVLASGTKVKESKLDFVTNTKNGYNVISGITMQNTGNKIKMTLSQSYSSSFKVFYENVNYDLNAAGIHGDFNASSIQIRFANTRSTPNFAIPANNIFSGISWVQEENSTLLTLKLSKAGRFMGFSTYYDSNKNLIFDFNNISPVSPGSLAGVRIFVDPGHGGSDPGNVSHIHGSQIKEADINRQISEKLSSRLSSMGAIVQMADTRNYVSLDDRVKLARNFGSNIFVSIHNNSASSTASGTETWWYNPVSKLMSQHITNKLSSYTGTRNRGAKFGNYVVTRYQDFPAALVECGFMTNQSELTNLLDSAYQTKIVHAVSEAINSYIISLF